MSEVTRETVEAIKAQSYERTSPDVLVLLAFIAQKDDEHSKPCRWCYPPVPVSPQRGTLRHPDPLPFEPGDFPCCVECDDECRDAHGSSFPVSPQETPADDSWCNCQAIPGTPNYPGPWHERGGESHYPCAAPVVSEQQETPCTCRSTVDFGCNCGPAVSSTNGEGTEQ